MKSFRQGITEAVLGGASTVDEVYARCATQVSAAEAMAANHLDETVNATRRAKGTRCGKGTPKRSTAAAIAIGRRRVVCQTLGRLCREGKIRRLARGVYGPPLPRVYQAG